MDHIPSFGCHGTHMPEMIRALALEPVQVSGVLSISGTAAILMESGCNQRVPLKEGQGNPALLLGPLHFKLKSLTFLLFIGGADQTICWFTSCKGSLWTTGQKAGT